VLLAFCFKLGGTWWEISFHQKKLREMFLSRVLSHRSPASARIFLAFFSWFRAMCAW